MRYSSPLLAYIDGNLDAADAMFRDEFFNPNSSESAGRLRGRHFRFSAKVGRVAGSV
jgi:hypothetical protein